MLPSVIGGPAGLMRSALLLMLQPGNVEGAPREPSGHCEFFRFVKRTGILHFFKNTLVVELPNIFGATPTYTNSETAVGVHQCASEAEVQW